MDPKKEIGAIFGRDGDEITGLVEQAGSLATAKEVTQMIGLYSGWLRVRQHERWNALIQWLDAKWNEDGQRDPVIWFHDTFVRFSEPYDAQVARRVRREIPAVRMEQMLDLARLFAELGIADEADDWIRVVLERATP